jgi:hypothetical protein
MRAPQLLAASVLNLSLGLGCASALYAPCDAQYQCADGLRCVNVGGDTGGLCTKPCTIVKKRAGYPDAAEDDKYYEDGAGQSDTIGDAACSDGNVDVTSEDADGPQKISVTPAAGTVVGVCRVSPEQLASTETDADSVLAGFCVPY